MGRSLGSQGRLQGLEVGFHDLEVVVAAGLVGDALERVEDVRLQIRVPGQGLGGLVGDQCLVEDGGDAVGLGLLLEVLDPGGAGLALGVDAGDGLLGEAVALGEVAEGGVVGEEDLGLGVLQAVLEVAVQAAQLLDQGLRCSSCSRPRGPGRPSRRPCRRPGRSRRTSPGRARHAGRGRASSSEWPSSPSWLCSEPPWSSRVVSEAASIFVLMPVCDDGLVDGGLETLEEEGRVGLLELGALLGADLQVVRLLAGLGQAGDVRVAAAYLLGEEGHRVERRDDVELVRVALRRAVAGAGGQSAEAESGEPRQADMRRRRTFMTLIFNKYGNRCQQTS